MSLDKTILIWQKNRPRTLMRLFERKNAGNSKIGKAFMHRAKYITIHIYEDVSHVSCNVIGRQKMLNAVLNRVLNPVFNRTLDCVLHDSLQKSVYTQLCNKSRTSGIAQFDTL